jgi:hypothetical protein
MNEKEYEVYEARERREDKAASYDKPILDGQWQKNSLTQFGMYL